LTKEPKVNAQGRARWWALVVLDLSLLAITIDNTIMNVALPTLAREFHATGSELQWIVDAYVLFWAGLLLTAGTLGDRFGRKKVLIIGLAMLGAGAIASSFATGAGQLIATRALMGAAAAFIMPATLSMITNIFDEHERPKAIATWSAVSGVGMVLGPIAGGWLLDNFSWNSIFLANLPIVTVGIVGALALVPESRDAHPDKADPIGAGLSIVGLMALVYGIIEAPNAGWTSLETILRVGAGLAVIAIFIGWELRSKAPMLELRLFLRPRFGPPAFAISAGFFAIAGGTFMLTQYLQFVRGLRPLEAGVALLPVAIGVVVGTALASRLLRPLGTKLVMGSAMAIMAVGLLMASRLVAASSYEALAACLLVISIGLGMASMPGTDSIMGAVPKARAGVGSATNDTTREIGCALGVAVLGSVLSSGYRDAIGSQFATLGPTLEGTAKDSIGAASVIAHSLPGDAGAQVARIANDAFMSGMSGAMLIGAIVVAAASAVIFAWLPARAPGSDKKPAANEHCAADLAAAG
jgi:EmrB/QacA subfamily drug resistance transporter